MNKTYSHDFVNVVFNTLDLLKKRNKITIISKIGLILEGFGFPMTHGLTSALKGLHGELAKKGMYKMCNRMAKYIVNSNGLPIVPFVNDKNIKEYLRIRENEYVFVNGKRMPTKGGMTVQRYAIEQRRNKNFRESDYEL